MAWLSHRGAVQVDREMPAVKSMLPLLKRGIGVHHSGLLPLLKEVVEILFQEQLIKASFWPAGTPRGNPCVPSGALAAGPPGRAGLQCLWHLAVLHISTQSEWSRASDKRPLLPVLLSLMGALI